MNKWIGTPNGLAKFDDNNWTVYDTSNSGLPDNYVYAIALDSSETKWIGTGGGGVAVFDDTSWVVYDEFNSDLPDDLIADIAIDSSGNKWIATVDGIAVYNENGIISITNVQKQIAGHFALKNYPNPFSTQTTIQYKLSESNLVTLNVYNLNGQLLKNLVNKKQSARTHTISWNGYASNGRQLPNGIYFYRLNSGNKRIIKRMILKR